MVRGVQRARGGQALAEHLVAIADGQHIKDERAVNHVREGQRRPSSRAARMSSMVSSTGSLSRAMRAMTSALVSVAASASIRSRRYPDSDWPSDLARSRRTASVVGSTSRTWMMPTSADSLIYPRYHDSCITHESSRQPRQERSWAPHDTSAARALSRRERRREPARSQQGGGTAPIGDRAVFTAVVSVLTAGCAWRHMPGEFGVSVPTAHRRFQTWTRAGVWPRLHRAVLDAHGEAGRVDWSSVIVDAASLRAKRGTLTGPSPVHDRVAGRLPQLDRPLRTRAGSTSSDFSAWLPRSPAGRNSHTPRETSSKPRHRTRERP
ncbi:hypothetical protein FAGKG844_350051 [Frankia sp. AgKG'84/4]